jgi:hypothetical protein
LNASIATLTASGIEVVISMGGWDFNCFGYLYTRYSVGGYGTSTPNYWKIQEYCDSNLDNSSPANEWCYTCEPPYANETLGDFAIFPEPAWSSTWTQATAWVRVYLPTSLFWGKGIVPSRQQTQDTNRLILYSGFLACPSFPILFLACMQSIFGLLGS